MNTVADTVTKIDATLSLANITELSTSEVHGTIVGAICNHLYTGLTPNLLQLIEPSATGDESHLAPVQQMLYDLYRDNSEVLFESKDGYRLLLPDDDESIDNRVHGIATWCKGFLLGLLYNDQFSIDQLPESGAEIARDLMEISEAAAGSDDEQEEDWALAELEEYVKVGSQLIFEFIYSERAQKAPTTPQ